MLRFHACVVYRTARILEKDVWQLVWIQVSILNGASSLPNNNTPFSKPFKKSICIIVAKCALLSLASVLGRHLEVLKGI